MDGMSVLASSALSQQSEPRRVAERPHQYKCAGRLGQFFFSTIERNYDHDDRASPVSSPLCVSLIFSLSGNEASCSERHTDLGAFELVKHLVRAQQAFDGLDVLLLLEARERVEVVDGLRQDLGLVEILALVAPLRDQRVDDERSLRQGQGVNICEFAQLQGRAGLFVAAGHRFRARGWGSARSLEVTVCLFSHYVSAIGGVKKKLFLVVDHSSLGAVAAREETRERCRGGCGGPFRRRRPALRAQLSLKYLTRIRWRVEGVGANRQS